MAGYADAQVRAAIKQWLDGLHQGDALRKAMTQLDRIREIAKEHESCECSAALMILEVLDRG